ncbi:MAG: efflux RND transporter permease subunit [Verrucomicrobiales bacterium]
MKGLVTWFARNPVAANLLMGLILAAGFAGWFKMRKEIFPETSLNVVAIRVPFPNAAPEEVEKGVCIPIEEAIHSTNGIKRISSYANESLGTVIVEILPSFKTRDVMADLKSRVDAIDNFAQEAEKPVMEELLIKNQTLSIAVTADTDEATLRRFAEKVRDDLLTYQLPKGAPGRLDAKPSSLWAGLKWEFDDRFTRVIRFFNTLFNGPAKLSQISVVNVRNYEISIEVSEETLRSYGLTLDQVALAVRASSLDLPAGSVRTDAGEVLIRTQSRRYTAPEFANITVITRPDGSSVQLGQIANIVDGFEDLDLFSRFDGKPAVIVNVFRTGDEDTLRVAELVRHYLKEAPSHLPAGVNLQVWNDWSTYLSGRMNLLFSNGLQGLVLIVLVLGLFLEPRLAFYVSLGIPISVAGGLLCMPFFDVSINMISLFAFILVLGVVVDDAIVIGENVHYRMTALGEPPQVAAPRGTNEVAVVVMFGVFVTVMAFTPMAMVHGVGGKIWRNIPWVVIPTLILSTIESKLILPAHLANMKVRPPGQRRGFIGRTQQRVEHGLDFVSTRIYKPVIQRLLLWRYVVGASFVALFILTIGVVAAGWVPFTFFPVVEGDMISAKLTLPEGVPVETTAAAVAKIEAGAKQLGEMYRDKHGNSVIRHGLATVGDQPFKTSLWDMGGGPAVHRGEVTVELCPAADRTVKAKELEAKWRELTGPVPGAVELTFRTNSERGGVALELMLSGQRLDELNAAAAWVKAKLATYRGVIDVFSSDREGKREMKLNILPQAEALGFRLADVSRQVRQSFYGEEAQRLQRGRDEVKVMVRYPLEERRSLQNLSEMKIRTIRGEEVPFSEVARADYGRGYAMISRTDRKRSVFITADVDRSDPEANANRIVAELKTEHLPEMSRLWPDVHWSFEGEQKSQMEDLRDMGVGAIFALLGIYILLAVPLRSYAQPLIVMSVIPFGLVGAVWGHMALGMELSIMTMCGCIALAGMVVNESLIMVDSINRHRRRGEPLHEAAWKAAMHRFKPIMATSVTTFVGLLPIMSETDIQALFLVPMSVALGFGGLFATAITLLLVPSIYIMLEDARNLLGLRARYAEADEIDEDAGKAAAPAL